MPQIDGSIKVKFDISIDDDAYPSSLEEYTLAYTLHLPAQVDPNLPCFILCHPFNNSREYWKPQLNDPILAPFPKIAMDAIGFAKSSTHGRPWTFDLAAYAILELLEKLQNEKAWPKDARYIVIGDSMGGAPTGLRLALRDAEHVRKGGRKRIYGVAACGTAAEEESADFVEEYTLGAVTFAKTCVDPSGGPEKAILNMATHMSNDGYTDSDAEPFASSRMFGIGVMARGLFAGLCTRSGMMDPRHAGEAMKTNFHCLNYRKSLIPLLAVRPTPLECQVLVVHGTEEKAYPFERLYHERTASAIGEDNAELYIVKGGPHFVTVTHAQELDHKILEWMERRCK